MVTKVALADINIPTNGIALPDEVVAFLGEADSRINEFLRHSHIRASGFIPSDFVTVYHALRAAAEANLAPGNLFCEWGSGFGVVASLAAMLEFDACGIEVERSLVDASRTLAEDFGLPVDFVHGSFIPDGGEAFVDEAHLNNADDDISWLATDALDAYDELGLEPDDFDLIYAYPWPGDVTATETLFQRYAAHGALLLTLGQDNTVRLQRKVG